MSTYRTSLTVIGHWLGLELSLLQKADVPNLDLMVQRQTTAVMTRLAALEKTEAQAVAVLEALGESSLEPDAGSITQENHRRVVPKLDSIDDYVIPDGEVLEYVIDQSVGTVMLVTRLARPPKEPTALILDTSFRTPQQQAELEQELTAVAPAAAPRPDRGERAATEKVGALVALI